MWAGADDGDCSGDGTVGPEDAALLAANWGYGSGKTRVVPEPGAIVQLLFMSITLLAGRGA